MNRASKSRARYSRPRSRRPSWAGWIPGAVAGVAVVAASTELALPLLKEHRLAGIALLALGAVGVAFSVGAGLETRRSRAVVMLVGTLASLVGYVALSYFTHFAPHPGYSVTIDKGASLATVQGEIRSIAAAHALVAETSFSSDRLKVDFPGGGPAAIGAAIVELHAAPGVAEIDACRGLLC